VPRSSAGLGATLHRTLLQHGRSFLARCIPTVDDIRGPFYREGAPLRERFCPPDEPGEPLALSGVVTGLPSCGPLSGALLDVWQTDARGFYSNMLGLGDPTSTWTGIPG
jgi:protocatechuate 3,4-dioxygenase beta subunit